LSRLLLGLQLAYRGAALSRMLCLNSRSKSAADVAAMITEGEMKPCIVTESGMKFRPYFRTDVAFIPFKLRVPRSLMQLNKQRSPTAALRVDLIIA
jgi:hypothetical protein